MEGALIFDDRNVGREGSCELLLFKRNFNYLLAYNPVLSLNLFERALRISNRKVMPSFLLLFIMCKRCKLLDTFMCVCVSVVILNVGLLLLNLMCSLKRV